MKKVIKVQPTDDELTTLQQHIVQLESALADYAQRYGLSDKARSALNFKSTPNSRQ